ncbi:unnamed protein product, partial [Larinioides sclopetarius]
MIFAGSISSLMFITGGCFSASFFFFRRSSGSSSEVVISHDDDFVGPGHIFCSKLLRSP